MIHKRIASASAVLLLANIGFAFVLADAAPQQRSSFAAHKRPALFSQARHVKASAGTYTLVDDGAPTSSTYALGSAVSFNNTGQIAGGAYYYNSSTYSGPCVLYDGKKYRVLTPSASMVSCNVNGMNDVNATTGALDVAANGTTVYSNKSGGYYGDQKAVYSTIVPKTGSIKTTVFPNDQSYLIGVNNAGTAVGIGVYQPKTGFATLDPPFVSQAGKAFTVAQPACSTVRLGCAGFPNFAGGIPPACGFGGCEITGDGTLFLVDLFTGSYELVSPDGTTQDVELGADVLPSIDYIGAPSINSTGQILYAIQTVVAGVQKVAPQIYNIGGPVVTVPPIAGKSCTQYIPLSFSNTGEVLGIVYGCAPDNGTTYFTYDAEHGTQDLAPELPASGYYALTPDGVNDKGQILVDLQLTNGGATHWGVLSPSLVSSRAKSSERRWSASGAYAVAVNRPSSLVPARRFTTVTIPSLIAPSRFPNVSGFKEPTSRPLRLQPRSILASAPAYSIVDYGAPASPGYSLSNPVAFNNTGQIVGIATDVPYRRSSTCILFDGSRFRNISASPTVVDCSPMSINDKNATSGSLAVVGNVVSAFSFGSGPYQVGSSSVDIKAFLSKIVPATGSVDTSLFVANDTSDLTSVNASGFAIGVGTYALNQNVYEPAFYVSPGTNSLRVLQPSCTTITATCDGYNLEQPCAFGGCSLTNDGTIFLNDVIINPDGTAQAFRLPDYDPYHPIINNAKQVLYRSLPRDFVRPSTPVYNSEVRIYQIGTGQEIKVPKIAGNPCTGYTPLSFNNSGIVIGRVSDCGATAADTYFIYDATNGTRDLAALLPTGNGAILPIGINDNGQILISITASDGTIHWGILQPSAASARRRTISGPRFH